MEATRTRRKRHLERNTVKTYRAGVVGCGFVAEAYHLPVQADMQEIETVALSDRAEDVAKKQAQAFGVSATYGDYVEMLDRADLDFVTVCVPPEHHLAVTRAAAERGIHVLSEKPMAPSEEDVRAIVDLVEETGIKYMIAENFWWHPDVIEAKKRVDAGVIGDIFHVRIEEFINDIDPTYRRERERFLIFEQDVHYVDVIRHLVDRPIARVHAITRKVPTQDLRGENFASILMEFDNGVVARIDECWCSARGDQFVMRIRIDGTKGSIFINAPDSALKIYTDTEGLVGWHFPATATLPPVGHSAGYAAPWPVTELRQGVAGVYRAFVDYLARGAAPVTVAADNAKTMEVVFAAYESASCGKVINLDHGREAGR
jgi:predicted dehydrogenase